MAKILCIDDEAAIRKLIAEELRDAGHELIEAADGESGLSLIKLHRPDLVLCDISMPRLDGYQVLERTRALGPEFRLMPFLFLSAMAEPRQVIAGKRLGADEYITKPIEFDDFLDVINRRLRR